MTTNYDVEDYDSVVQVVEPLTFKELDLTKPRGLLVYFGQRYQEVNGFPYVFSWEREMNIFKAFIDRYGKDSGDMVKLLFDKYKGVIANSRVSATAFTVGCKWIQDILYSDVQQERLDANKPVVKVEGLLESGNFLQRFSA